MKFSPKSLLLNLLKVGQNVRVSKNLKLDTLATDIESVGLQNPIQVWKPDGSKEEFEVLRGHRRYAAIQKIAADNPPRFEELFGKGLPCLVVSDITATEALVLKVDHGNELSLSDPFEVQMCANLLFAAGKSEGDVVDALAGLMDRISPMRGKNRKELEAIESAAKAADLGGDKLLAEAKKKEAKEYVFKYRRGLVQGMHNAYRCPAKVMAALAQKAGGTVPTEYGSEFLPDLTSNDVKELWKAHTEDLTILENGKPKFNEDRPGPAFRSKWEKLVIDTKDAASKVDKPARPKSMAASEIMAAVTEGKFKSEIACKLCALHAGDKSFAEDVAKLDKDAYLGDLVKGHNPELWAMIVEEADKIMVAIRAADKAAPVVA